MIKTPAILTSATLAEMNDGLVEALLEWMPVDHADRPLAFQEMAKRAQAKHDAALEKAQRTVLLDEGFVVTFKPRQFHYEERRDYDKTTRVYPWELDRAFPDLAASEAALPTPKERGEDPENDKAYDRHNRLYARLARQVAKNAIDKLVELGKIEAPLVPLKLSYSRFAGCSSCPCSGGVVVNTHLFDKKGARVDIYIDAVNKN